MYKNLKNVSIIIGLIIWLLPLKAQRDLKYQIPFLNDDVQINMGILYSQVNYDAPFT